MIATFKLIRKTKIIHKAIISPVISSVTASIRVFKICLLRVFCFFPTSLLKIHRCHQVKGDTLGHVHMVKTEVPYRHRLWN